MTAAVSPSFVLDDLREAAVDPGVRRRAGAYAIAAVMHAAALWALIVLPPAVLPPMERAASAISVRLYTVAGGADAESDAPLFEPPLAGGASGTETGQPGADGGAGGESAADGGAGSTAQTADAEPEAQPLPVEDPADSPAPDSAPERVEAIPEPSLSPAVGAPAPAASGAAPQQPDPSSAGPSRPGPAASAPADPGAPVATTQPPAEPVSADASPSQGPPSFADILARAETRLDPDDFRLLANFGDGVTQTVRSSFCLSSSDANREAFDCPEGSDLEAARLAQYGLTGLGEEPPEFLEDMDRLAYQLSTLGADDNRIMRILTVLRESRREALNTPAIQRRMAEDARPENNNDVPGAP